jgi:DNA-binding transcriptional regulator YdaS (Cro superfamily)
MSKRHVRQAIRLFGSQQKLAVAIGFTQHAIWYAAHTGHVTPQMAFGIHAATKGRVSYASLLDIKRQLKRARKRINGKT